MTQSSPLDLYDRISLDLIFNRFSLDTEDPDEYIYTIEGKIILSVERDDEDDGEEIIGAYRLLYIDADSALENGVSLEEVYDCDGEAFEFYEDAVNPKSREFKSSVSALLDEEVGFQGSNVLIIDRIGICPEYRGHHLALKVLRKLIQHFVHGVSLIAIKPAPFEFTNSHIKSKYVDWEYTEIDKNSSEAKELGKYYQRLGFRKMRGSAFMVLGVEKKLLDV